MDAKPKLGEIDFNIIDHVTPKSHANLQNNEDLFILQDYKENLDDLPDDTNLSKSASYFFPKSNIIDNDAMMLKH